MKVYLKNKKLNVYAIGNYNPDDNSLVVLSGSRISNVISTAPSFKGTNSIVKNREKYAKGSIVETDVTFKSPSTAGNFVTGRSTDGLTSWKNKSGKSIKDILHSTK